VYSVSTVSAEGWKNLSKGAHLATFGEIRENLDRVDFALLTSYKGELGGYFTIKEMDANTAYIQHGGVFDNFRNSYNVLKGFKATLDTLKVDYLRIWHRVENTNIPMIKLSLSQGFIINGCSLVNSKLYLEMLLEV